jgi:uncharacterized membrane protein YdjX (TVP38/TMEM64 family)
VPAPRDLFRRALRRARTLDRRTVITGALVLVGLIALSIFYRHIDLADLHRRAGRLNGFVVYALIVVLPLVCFPVSAVHAVAGARFGLGLGFLLVATTIILQLLLAYALVRAAPDFFSRHLEWIRRRLPKAAHTPLTQLTMLLPGAPYWAQLYVLPLVGVPLRVYLLWSLPITVARSIVGILFGDLSGHLTPGRIAGFVVYFAVITAGSVWAFRRLQARIQGRPRAANGRTRAASRRSAARKRAAPRTPSK